MTVRFVKINASFSWACNFEALVPLLFMMVSGPENETLCYNGTVS